MSLFLCDTKVQNLPFNLRYITLVNVISSRKYFCQKKVETSNAFFSKSTFYPPMAGFVSSLKRRRITIPIIFLSNIFRTISFPVQVCMFRDRTVVTVVIFISRASAEGQAKPRALDLTLLPAHQHEIRNQTKLHRRAACEM